jgi:hypothetical protein
MNREHTRLSRSYLEHQGWVDEDDLLHVLFVRPRQLPVRFQEPKGGYLRKVQQSLQGCLLQTASADGRRPVNLGMSDDGFLLKSKITRIEGVKGELLEQCGCTAKHGSETEPSEGSRSKSAQHNCWRRSPISKLYTEWMLGRTKKDEHDAPDNDQQDLLQKRRTLRKNSTHIVYIMAEMLPSAGPPPALLHRRTRTTT